MVGLIVDQVSTEMNVEEEEVGVAEVEGIEASTIEDSEEDEVVTEEEEEAEAVLEEETTLEDVIIFQIVKITLAIERTQVLDSETLEIEKDNKTTGLFKTRMNCLDQNHPTT